MATDWTGEAMGTQTWDYSTSLKRSALSVSQANTHPRRKVRKKKKRKKGKAIYLAGAVPCAT